MDENNNNVNETDIADSSTTPETGKSDTSKPVSAFELPDDNRINASPEQKTDSPSVPAYYTPAGNTASSSERNTETNASQTGTYNSYSNVVSEPSEFSTGFGIASLVMGILSILTSCCCGLGILMSILGIIFGCIQSKDESGKKPGMAIAGIATSIAGIVSGILIIAIFVIAGMFD